MRNRIGFTLIELLIIIAIIGILAGFMLTNMMGARSRARDARAKTDMDELKKGLELYRGVYRSYPKNYGSPLGLDFYACGGGGDQVCPVCSTGDFAAGGSDGCKNIFVPYLSRNESGRFNFKYYPCGGDDYRVKVTLENKSDPEIAKSQLQCPPACGTTYIPATDYVICP